MAGTTLDVLREWIHWATKVQASGLYYRRDFDMLASALDTQTVGQLANFYSRAIRERHRGRINVWLKKTSGRVPMSWEEKSVRNLAILFGHLAELDIDPFTQQVLSTFDVSATPDWSKLPSDLRFLGATAELAARRYHYVFSEAEPNRIPAMTNQTDLNSFKIAADEIRSAGFERVKEWYTNLGVREHIEARMIFSLIGVLDALELPYYKDGES